MSGGNSDSYERTYRGSESVTRSRREEEEADREFKRQQEALRNARNERERAERQREAEAAEARAQAAKVERERLERERKARLTESATRTEGEEARSRAKSAEKSSERVDPSLARNSITEPPKEVDEIYIALVDNSGSNRRIAEAIREAAGHIHGAIGAMAPKAAIAFMFFSDHRDGDRLFQYADYTTAGTRGESVLRASVANIANANGFDEAEAIECALHQVSQFNFGHITREKRHLILVTDVVGHGMGLIDDDGCPYQVSWRRSLEEVALQFGSFRVVATGNDSHVLELQAKFVPSDRRRFDLLDMVTGGLSPEERARLVPNAFLFQVFRTMGLQAVESFLGGLYEKWLASPMYGSNTKPNAQAQIKAFARYLEIDDERLNLLLERVFGE